MNDHALEVPARGGRNRPVRLKTRLLRVGSEKFSMHKTFLCHIRVSGLVQECFSAQEP